jgi:membrane-bound metal-dependent hydrolase YbcI (DUF457 family)
VDPLTHGVATLALQRGFFPRASARAVLGILAAGVASDVDSVTRAFSPGTFFEWHRTATHSVAFLAALGLAGYLFSRASARAPKDRWRGLSAAAIVAAGALHLALDLLEADAMVPLWPFSRRRVSLDLLPGLDPWLLSILALAILLPELARLVGEEIGSRSKRPRGRNGALAGLAGLALYLCLRAVGHANAAAALEARTIAGEMPRRVGAFPDATSPFLWHCVVETQSALHLMVLRSAGEVRDASGVTTLHKPEPSAMLDAARSSPAAVALLQAARFPKATLQKVADGYSVQIQDLKDQAMESRSAVVANITLDRSLKVAASELDWQKRPSRP